MSSSNVFTTPQSGLLTSPYRTPEDADAILLGADGTPLPFANPTNLELLDTMIGYYHTSFGTLFTLKTSIIALEDQATLVTFPELSLLDEVDRDSIFSMYSMPELLAIRKKTTKLLSKLERTSLTTLKTHIDTFDKIMKIRKQEELDDHRLDNLLTGFVLYTHRPTPVPSSTVHPIITSVPSSRNLPIVPHRLPCNLPPVLQALNQPKLVTYETKIINRIYTAKTYVPMRSELISFLDQSGNYLEATALLSANFILEEELNYGKALGIPFKLTVPNWDYHELLTMLDHTYYPATAAVDTVLADLEKIIMAPVSKLFTFASLVNYKDYFSAFNIYLIKNAEMVKNQKESVIVNRFITNMSFDPTILKLKEKEHKTMAACLVDVDKYLKVQEDYLSYMDTPSIVPSPPLVLPSPPVVLNNVAVKVARPKATPTQLQGCWNCENQTVPPGTRKHTRYWLCPLNCKFCTEKCKGKCQAFLDFSAPRVAALEKLRPHDASVKVRLLPGSSTITNLSTIPSVCTNHIIPDVVHNIVNIPNNTVLLPIIDSGATYSCINNVDLLVQNSLTMPTLSNSLGVVMLSDSNTTLPIVGTGKFIDFPSLDVHFVPSLGESLLSVSDIVDKNNIVLFDKMNNYCISCSDEEVISKYNQLIDYSKQHNLISLTSTRSSDKLYRLDPSIPPTTDRVKSKTSSKTKKRSTYSFPIHHNTINIHHNTINTLHNSMTLEEVVTYYHRAWNHASMDMMISNISNNVYMDTNRLLTIDAIKKHFPRCMACSVGSMKQRPHPRTSVRRNIALGAEVQVDVQHWYSAGNSDTIAYNGAKYVLTCIDLASDYTWTYSLRDLKYMPRYLEFLRVVIFHKQRKLSIIRCDNAFITKDMRDWAMQEKVGVQLLPCIPHEHYQIGRIERKHQTLHHAVIKALYQPHLNKRYWYMALRDAVHKSNIQSKSRLSGASSYRLWHGIDPDTINHPILPFGTVVMAHVPLALQNTFSGAAVVTYYIGCAIDYHGGLLLWNPTTLKSCIRRTYKVLGPTLDTYTAPTIMLDPPTAEEIRNMQFIQPIPEPMDIISPVRVVDRVTRSSTTPPPDTENGVTIAETGVSPTDSMTENDIIDHILPPSSITATNILPENELTELPAIQPTYVVPPTPQIAENSDFYQIYDPVTNTGNQLKKYFLYIGKLFIDSETHESFTITAVCRTPSSTRPFFQFYDHTRYPTAPAHQDDYEYTPCSEILSVKDYKFLSPIHHINHITTNVSDYSLPDKPMTIAMISSHPHSALLEEALNKELQSYVRNGAITASTLTPAAIKAAGYQLLSVRVIFSIKLHHDGSFNKYKVRMVLRGDKWRNIDNIDLYASTVRVDSLRLIFSLVCHFNLEIAFFDVETAFLVPPLKLDEHIYIKRPNNLDDSHMPAISKVNKCIYGLPQAAKYFEDDLNAKMASLNFKPLVTDPKLFIRRTGDEFVIVATHVDDNFVAATNIELRSQFLAEIGQLYNITVVLDPPTFLGINLNRDRTNNTLSISQPLYITTLLEKHNISLVESHPPSTPMVAVDIDPIIPLPPSPLLDSHGITKYQSRIGGLLYLAIMTRPDILYAVITLSQYTQAPTEQNLLATNRILRYVAGTIDLTMQYHKSTSSVLSLNAYADASYNVHRDNKSHSGLMICIGDFSAPLLFSSKKQTITADSSTVAELIAAHAVTKELQWVINMLTELGFSLPTTPILHQDNMSTIKIFNQPGNSGKTKHISLRFNIVRELRANGTIHIIYCPTEDMLADIFTKAFGPSAFLQLRPLLMGHTNTTALAEKVS